MKIAIIGYSGSGKSTLGQHLAKYYGIEILHLDAVHHLPGWKERTKDEERKIVRAFLDTHTNWIIDGTYSKLYYEERMENADQIYIFQFNRFNCLYRAIKRYFKYRQTTRPDMAQGCQEKMDLNFALWILYKGRSKTHRTRLHAVEAQYANKVTVIRNQKQLNKILKMYPYEK